jgi:amidase
MRSKLESSAWPSDSVAEALATYARTEPAIHAWVEVNPQAPTGSGVLQGLPFGVKDIIETAGLATEYGSTLFKGRKGTEDAAIVANLRNLGGVLFGKTHTTAFASFDPAPTRNPRNPAHTPGGSSSGSAAAVAAGVTPFALGTQTLGSIIRPASFCGITGFKPTFGALPTEGVLPFAPSLDTVGLLAENIAMCVRVWTALGFSDYTETFPARFAVVLDLPPVETKMQQAFDCVLERLRTFHAVESIRLPKPYEHLLAAARLVNDYEGSRSHYGRWKTFDLLIGEKLAALVQRGMQISEAEYKEACHLLKETGTAMDTVFSSFPILLTPATPGPAPLGLESTGDPIMNAVWTALGTPAVTIPMPIASQELPLGLQLIAARRNDGMLLKVASTVEELLRNQIPE